MYMYIDSDMHVKILHRQVHDYMYIDTCDISMYIYIYTYSLVLVGSYDALQSIHEHIGFL